MKKPMNAVRDSRAWVSKSAAARRIVIAPISILAATVIALRAFFVVQNYREHRKAIEEVRTAKANLEQARQQAIKEGRPVDLTPMQKALDQAAGESTGQSAALYRASSAELRDFQTLASNFNSADHELATAQVTRGRGVTQREQLQSLRAVVQKYLDANDAMSKYQSDRVTRFAEQLKRENVSERNIAVTLDGFTKRYSRGAAETANILDAKRRIGEGMLEVIQVFDSNWGQWHYDDARNRVIFQTASGLQAYRAAMTNVNASIQDEKAARKRYEDARSQQGNTPAQ